MLASYYHDVIVDDKVEAPTAVPSLVNNKQVRPGLVKAVPGRLIGHARLIYTYLLT